jgi:cytochrome c oxidase subunit 2
LATAALALAGCSTEDKAQIERLGMPESASDRADFVSVLWNWSWLAVLIVGVLVWGLIIYAMIKFRRRSDDEVPVQTRYNLPIEILYTIVPFIMVAVFFYFTVVAQDEVLAGPEGGEADHTVHVVAQTWSWTFNYIEDDALDGATTVYQPGTISEPPTLYLPVDESVTFELTSPDVIHSFWVPAFHMKMDVVPGLENSFTLTPTELGSYVGKCAELCGVSHSRMLFNLEVVTAEEFAAKLAELRDAGNVGHLTGGDAADTVAGLDTENENGDHQ